MTAADLLYALAANGCPIAQMIPPSHKTFQTLLIHIEDC